MRIRHASHATPARNKCAAEVLLLSNGVYQRIVRTPVCGMPPRAITDTVSPSSRRRVRLYEGPFGVDRQDSRRRAPRNIIDSRAETRP